MRNKYIALGVTALLALGAGCASSTTTNTNTTTDTTNTTPVLEVPVAANSNVNEAIVVEDDSAETDEVAGDDAVEATVQEFDVVATQFEFTPGTITVKKGDIVKLNLSSSDVPHGFALSAFNVSETLTPGKTKTVEFVADQAGTFTFSCTIVCGAGHSGMSGKLVVTE